MVKFYIILILGLFGLAFVSTESFFENELSDEDHFIDGEHNFEYDHEAFLGEEEAEIFDGLRPEQSKERLGELVDEIDADGDGFVSLDELTKVIAKNQEEYVKKNAKEQWEARNPDLKEKLSWEEYKEHVYGFLKDNPDYPEGSSDTEAYAQMQNRDDRRWKVADDDGDGLLTLEEFTAFVHPHEAKRMTDVIVEETINDVDKDGDGLISVDEYIEDVFRSSSEAPEQEWVTDERRAFETQRDLDQSGSLDKEEVRHWVTAPLLEEGGAAGSEARHLMILADTNEDEKLSKDEIVGAYKVFVGSQATAYGDKLEEVFVHDEF